MTPRSLPAAVDQTQPFTSEPINVRSCRERPIMLVVAGHQNGVQEDLVVPALIEHGEDGFL